MMKIIRKGEEENLQRAQTHMLEGELILSWLRSRLYQISNSKRFLIQRGNPTKAMKIKSFWLQVAQIQLSIS